MNITNKGLIFSTDLIITVSIMLFSIFFFLIIINNNFQQNIEFEKEKYLESKTIFVADSFVKNFNENNTLLGACIIDFEKKRVLSNEINSNNFSKIKELEITDFFIKKISYKNYFEEKTFYENKLKKPKNCVSISRFVLLNSIKSIITFTGCLND